MIQSSTKLSVNLNKVALLRNQRDVGYPGVIEHGQMVLEAGAHGLTAHPRPDERHIRRSDIADIAAFLGDWPDKEIEFNIEGYPSEEFLTLVTKHACDQVTLVPDDPHQRTSDHGWDTKEHKEWLSETVKRLQEEGRRVSLFIDPVPELIKHAIDTGAERIELYTGPYAEKHISLETYAQSALTAQELGLEINAGHDLNLDNLGAFITAIPACAEVSIGHAITADALKMGWHGAVIAYLTAIEYGQKAASANAAKSE